MSRKWRLGALAAVGCLVILIGIAAAWGAQPLTDYPAFTMVREVTRGDGTEVYQLVYDENGAWREMLVSSSTRPNAVGWFSVGSGNYVPGMGFLTKGAFIGHRGRPRAATVMTERSGSDDVVTVVRGFEWTEARYDVATGILVRLEHQNAGRMVVRHVVTSLVLATGETVR